MPGRVSSRLRDGTVALRMVSEEHELIRQTVRQFAQTRVEPQAMEHDESGTFNVALLRELGELGLLGVTIPEADGGAGLDATASCIVHDELAYADPGFTLAYLAHALLFVNNFYWAGERRRSASATCRRCSPASAIGAMGMTEPAVGTDVLGMQTIARRDGDSYVLERPQDVHHERPRGATSFARLREARRSHHDVRRRARVPRLLDEPEDPEDRHARVDDERAHLRRLPRAGREPARHRGRRHHEHDAQPRDRAARPLGDEPRHRAPLPRRDGALRDRSAARSASRSPSTARSSATSARATRRSRRCARSIYNVAATVGPTQRNRLGTDAAKLFAATAAKEVADAAMQVLGGYGYCTEYRVEQFWRDAKLIEIGGGTLEAHQKNITRDLTRALAVAITSRSRSRPRQPEPPRCLQPELARPQSPRSAEPTAARRSDRVHHRRAVHRRHRPMPSGVTRHAADRRPARPPIDVMHRPASRSACELPLRSAGSIWRHSRISCHRGGGVVALAGRRPTTCPSVHGRIAC